MKTTCINVKNNIKYRGEKGQDYQDHDCEKIARNHFYCVIRARGTILETILVARKRVYHLLYRTFSFPPAGKPQRWPYIPHSRVYQRPLFRILCRKNTRISIPISFRGDLPDRYDIKLDKRNRKSVFTPDALLSPRGKETRLYSDDEYWEPPRSCRVTPPPRRSHYAN
ncbi:hypothetical protein DBV15_07944 [Temnothorax longispinosus]|uniref:Uncharacterized protein n=1 Tax=Temnothorax longispinosus TaxID=300112 RepID=A0A4S2KRK2_9HYME|nr:hypothetical protein DBV15_07944 [Temnothorax longispinosus]